MSSSLFDRRLATGSCHAEATTSLTRARLDGASPGRNNRSWQGARATGKPRSGKSPTRGDRSPGGYAFGIGCVGGYEVDRGPPSTPVGAQRVCEATLTKLLKQHRIRRVDAAPLCDRLPAQHVGVAPGAAERLVLVNRQLAHARSPLDRLVHQFAEAAPAEDPDAPAETDPEPSPRPDAAFLLSLPGIGTGVLATLSTVIQLSPTCGHRKIPHPLVNASLTSTPVDACGQAVCGLSNSRWARGARPRRRPRPQAIPSPSGPHRSPSPRREKALAKWWGVLFCLPFPAR